MLFYASVFHLFGRRSNSHGIGQSYSQENIHEGLLGVITKKSIWMQEDFCGLFNLKCFFWAFCSHLIASLPINREEILANSSLFFQIFRKWLFLTNKYWFEKLCVKKLLTFFDRKRWHKLSDQTKLGVFHIFGGCEIFSEHYKKLHKKLVSEIKRYGLCKIFVLVNLRSDEAIRHRKFFFQIWTHYIPFDRILCWTKVPKEPMSENEVEKKFYGPCKIVIYWLTFSEIFGPETGLLQK